ncbi:Ribonuclease H-like superfamily [Sesbania bispinosa]|nr:Ribonuclease H-like superfamily [Sesbania bispinosa]
MGYPSLGTRPKPSEILQLTQIQVGEWLEASATQPQTSHPHSAGSHFSQWRSPTGDTLKINIDASWSPTNNYVAIGVVVRDSGGLLVSGLAKKIAAPSPLIAEALALREAIHLAHNLQWSKCLFESDNIQVIDACRGESKVGEIEAIVTDMAYLQPSFARCGFTWVKREGNECANFVARSCLRGSLPPDWVIRPPPQLRALLSKDLQRSLVQ